MSTILWFGDALVCLCMVSVCDLAWNANWQ